MRTIILPAVILLLAGCGVELQAPEAQSLLDGLPEGLDVRFTVSPANVAPHQPFSVRLDVVNTTAQPIEVVTGNSCLAVPAVLRHQRRIPVAGSAYGCWTVITTHTFAPGQTRTLQWHMRAETDTGESERSPLQKGSYIVRTEFGVVRPGNEPPAVEAVLRVQ